MDILIGVYFSNLFITIFQINYRFNKILYFYLPLFTIMHTLHIAIEFGNKDIWFLFRNWFPIVCHSEPFGKKNHPPYNSQKPKVNPTKKRKKRLVNRFLKEKIQVSKLKFTLKPTFMHFIQKSAAVTYKKKEETISKPFLKGKKYKFWNETCPRMPC